MKKYFLSYLCADLETSGFEGKLIFKRKYVLLRAKQSDVAKNESIRRWETICSNFKKEWNSCVSKNKEIIFALHESQPHSPELISKEALFEPEKKLKKK